MHDPQVLFRQGLQDLREQLGWFSEFTEDFPRWHARQEVVNAAFTFINQQSLSRGAADQLAPLLSPRTLCTTPQSAAPRTAGQRRVALTLRTRRVSDEVALLGHG